MPSQKRMNTNFNILDKEIKDLKREVKSLRDNIINLNNLFISVEKGNDEKLFNQYVKVDEMEVDK